MSAVWGNNLKVSIFGESHGNAIGINIDGLPAGFELDMDKILEEMARRAPGRNQLSTARKEADLPEILSQFSKGKLLEHHYVQLLEMEIQDLRTMRKLRTL